jgi:hypothetical protein
MKDPNYAPVYAAAMYPGLAEITRAHGWALAVHGTLARDFDLTCIPWQAQVSEPQKVVDAILAKYAIRQVHGWTAKEHGRQATTLVIGFGDCFVDLSFMPYCASAD